MHRRLVQQGKKQHIWIYIYNLYSKYKRFYGCIDQIAPTVTICFLFCCYFLFLTLFQILAHFKRHIPVQKTFPNLSIYPIQYNANCTYAFLLCNKLDAIDNSYTQARREENRKEGKKNYNNFMLNDLLHACKAFQRHLLLARHSNMYFKFIIMGSTCIRFAATTRHANRVECVCVCLTIQITNTISKS